MFYSYIMSKRPSPLTEQKLKKSVPENCVDLEDISKQEILVNSLLLPEDD